MPPGRSCNNSNFEVWPGRFPVAVGFGDGLASASLVLIAFIFLFLLAPSFFFRFPWFGIVVPPQCWLQIDFRFSEKIFTNLRIF